MTKMIQRCTLALLLLIPAVVEAAYVFDDVFQVNIINDGTFGNITLDGTEIDSGDESQRQFVNGEELIDGGDVTELTPTSAAYTAYVGNSNAEHVLQVDVVSEITGPVRGYAASNNTLRQTFTFTNIDPNGQPQALDSVSLFFPYLSDDPADDLAQVDFARAIPYATDSASMILVAIAAALGEFDRSWQVGLLYGIWDGSDDNIPHAWQLTDNETVGPDPSGVEMAVGLSMPLETPGGASDGPRVSIAYASSLTMTFDYFFTLNATVPPAGFPVPTPGTIGLLLLGLGGLHRLAGGRRR